eukprot:scaffold125415_cov48-Phaeocystis_antarctica.AAC.1
MATGRMDLVLTVPSCVTTCSAAQRLIWTRRGGWLVTAAVSSVPACLAALADATTLATALTLPTAALAQPAAAVALAAAALAQPANRCLHDSKHLHDQGLPEDGGPTVQR